MAGNKVKPSLTDRGYRKYRYL